MPIAVEPPDSRRAASRIVAGRHVPRDGLVIALVNNMPDAALQATEEQFLGLLRAAAGAQPLRVRLCSLPELPRGTEALARISRSYWPIDELLSQPPDALIVTGTEPRETRLEHEPYWERLVGLLEWAQEHTAASIWSCLAAHAAVLELDRIERRRLPHKRSGVYAHDIRAGHPLLEGVEAPLYMPHSRWNDLPVQALREAGYTVLSWSAETGADAFLREQRSPLLLFQGHPEYEPTTLLREYRRDVGRYLSGRQAQYPTLPAGCFSATARATLEAFREQALAQRRAELYERFPFVSVAAELPHPWRSAAVSIYRNWLSLIASARSAGARSSAGVARPSMSPGPQDASAAAGVRERLLRLVAEGLGRPDEAAMLPLEARLSELGMSSIKMVILMLALEREFGLTIPQGDITPENLRSVASIDRMLVRLLADRS